MTRLPCRYVIQVSSGANSEINTIAIWYPAGVAPVIRQHHIHFIRLIRAGASMDYNHGDRFGRKSRSNLKPHQLGRWTRGVGVASSTANVGVYSTLDNCQNAASILRSQLQKGVSCRREAILPYHYHPPTDFPSIMRDLQSRLGSEHSPVSMPLNR
jgi:hypothetical protein